MRRQKKRDKAGAATAPTTDESRASKGHKGKGWAPPHSSEHRAAPAVRKSAQHNGQGRTTSYPQQGVQGGARPARAPATSSYPTSSKTGYRGFESIN